MEWLARLKKLLSPSFIVPAVLSVGIIVALLAFADVKTVVALIARFPLGNLLWFLALMAVYELVRYAQWHFLLEELGVRAPLRPQVFSFVMSEFSRNLPVGAYFQNYLLQQSTGAAFSLTSAATTLILVSEVALCLIGVVILGVGAWTAEARGAIIGGVALLLLLIWAYTRLRRSSRLPEWIAEHKHLRKIADAAARFREGEVTLFHPRILIIQGVLGAAYLLIASAGLYVIMQGLGPAGRAITFPQAVAVYLFTLATATILPLPEVGGVAALLALGLTRNIAVSAMLLNRVLSMAFALVSAVVTIAVLPGELRAVLKARGQEQEQAPAHQGITAGTPARVSGEQS